MKESNCGPRLDDRPDPACNLPPIHVPTGSKKPATASSFTTSRACKNDAEQLHSLGRETSWDECVAEFDTDAFAAAMNEVGAGYVIFTVMQRRRTLIAPNATFDRISGYRPGEACTRRDLIEDLYQSLARYKIPLMLYYTGDGPCDDPQASKAFNWTYPINDTFLERWSSVAREYGERYGKKVAGWWVDGCYPWLEYNDERLGVFAEALRAGNPDRIIAFNRGVDPKVMSLHEARRLHLRRAEPLLRHAFESFP